VRCAVPALEEALERVEALYDGTCRVGDGLLLINRRTSRSLNSALANLEQMVGDVDPVRIGPEDAARFGLSTGDEVRLSTDDGEIVATVAIDDDLRAGVIAMNHGGGSVGDGQPVAAARSSVNVNRIMPQGQAIEPFSGMAHLTGVPVTLTPVARVGSPSMANEPG
jgi:anaerobic selenocysteine-containing dehydrogenase